jgi:hypothetical protein
VIDSILLLLLILINVALLAVVLVTIWYARRLISSVQDTIYSFFEATPDNGPSQFAEMIDKSAAILSARIITSAQAAMRGSAGGAAKGAAAAEQAEAIQANPLLGLLGGKLGKSPLATLALSLLGSKLVGNKESTGNGATPATQTRFKLGL